MENNKIILTEYVGREEIVKIPNKIDGKEVVKVASFCFFDNSNIKEIYFPENISIEDNAIVGCANLIEIKIPSPVFECVFKIICPESSPPRIELLSHICL